MPETTAAPSIATEQLGAIFDACDANRSGDLDVSEMQYALQACGLYPSAAYVQKKAKKLKLRFPLDKASFQKLVGAVEASGGPRGPRTVPYSRRGLSLKQLKQIEAAVLDTDWLPRLCREFNELNDQEIRAKTKFEMQPNLYAMNAFLVQATTSEDPSAREKIPKEILRMAEIPGVPPADCCFAQLLNPEGLDVDFFVSHYWGHAFSRTVQALTNFAEEVYESISKSSPDEVVFWICLFSLNQHRAAEEVGATPEEGPFNAALAKARHGAVMVLDRRTEPITRIWCLFEVSRAKDFNQAFRLIFDGGDLAKAGASTLEEISARVFKLTAFEANASRASDKDAILYHILPPPLNRVCSFEQFKEIIEKRCLWVPALFSEFDAHVCSLISTPLLRAGLKAGSGAVCARAVGMGADATVADLESMTQLLRVDLKAEVETPHGRCGLAKVFARAGRAKELCYVLDRGAAVDARDSNGVSALHLAAKGGDAEACALLLDRGAELGAKIVGGLTALHIAATGGHAGACALLLDRGAELDAKSDDNWTALHFAATAGHVEACALLVDRGAELGAKMDCGATALQCAARGGHEEACAVLRSSTQASICGGCWSWLMAGSFGHGLPRAFFAPSHAARAASNV